MKRAVRDSGGVVHLKEIKPNPLAHVNKALTNTAVVPITLADTSSISRNLRVSNWKGDLCGVAAGNGCRFGMV